MLSASVPTSDFATFPVLSLGWACCWSDLAGYALIVDDAPSFELVTVNRPDALEPSWAMRPTDDGVSMSTADDGWSEEHLFPSLRAALLAICGLTEARTAAADRVVWVCFPVGCD